MMDDSRIIRFKEWLHTSYILVITLSLSLWSFAAQGIICRTDNHILPCKLGFTWLCWCTMHWDPGLPTHVIEVHAPKHIFHRSAAFGSWMKIAGLNPLEWFHGSMWCSGKDDLCWRTGYIVRQEHPFEEHVDKSTCSHQKLSVQSKPFATLSCSAMSWEQKPVTWTSCEWLRKKLNKIIIPIIILRQYIGQASVEALQLPLLCNMNPKLLTITEIALFCLLFGWSRVFTSWWCSRVVYK